MSIRLKELEGQRLYRALRYFFKKRKFNFHWTNQQTSYFDGKSVHIIYDVQRPHLREFTPAEERIIRYGHAYHEVGHYLFDHLDSYVDWLNGNSTKVQVEWKDDWDTHKKYPLSWLQFFGNFGLDGRMEHLLRVYYSPTSDYLDFVNAYWVFPEGFQEECGNDPLMDFRTLYGCRVLDVPITGTFHEDAVALLESQEDLLAQINQQNSTKECLSIISQIMENTWPTLLEWLEDSNEDVSNDNEYTEDMTQGQWGENEEETQEHTQAAREVQEQQGKSSGKSEQSENSSSETGGDSSENETTEGETSEEGNNSESSSEEQANEEEETSESSSQSSQSDEDVDEENSKDFEALIRAIEREMKKDLDEAEQQDKDEAHYHGSYYSGGEDAKFVVQPLEEKPNAELYQKQVTQLRSKIHKMKKELEALVLPVSDQNLRNQRKGKIMPRSVWRATHCNDMNIHQQKVKGRPGKDVYISLMADVSGSTLAPFNNTNRVYEEIRDSLITIVEATQAVGIGSKAFAFTSDYHITQIFKLKTRIHELTHYNRGLIGSLTHLLGNRDAVALRYLIDDTKEVESDIKIAFMISDGEPNFYADETEDTIRNLVQTAKQENIHVICIFVGNDQHGLDCAKRMYGNRVIHAEKGIAREVQQQIKLILQ